MERLFDIKEYKISGMSCAACSAAVERVVKRLPFVESASVNLSTERLRIRGVSINTEAVIHAVEKAGFSAAPIQDRKAQLFADRIEQERLLKDKRRRVIISASFCAGVFLLSMIKMISPLSRSLSLSQCIVFTMCQILMLVPVIVCGRDFYIRGFKAVIKLHPNMDTLVSLGTLSSAIYSIFSFVRLIRGSIDAFNDMYWDSSAVIITLVMLGKYFETRSKDKTLESVRALRSLTPDRAVIRHENGEYESVDVEHLMKGDTVEIQPGSRIPCDGTITEGTGYVDESMITGESIPVLKKVGDQLYAGTLNGNSHYVIKADSVGEETSVAEMIRLVEDAQLSKAPISRLADKIAAVFVPVVTVIAIICGAAWLISGSSLSTALNIFVSVLVVACPCSLGLATPTAIMVGTGIAAEKGILIKGGATIENAHKITTVCFDKTGTLTKGKPEVTDIILASESLNRYTFLQMFASAEMNSEHPLGKAIVELAEKERISLFPCEESKAIPGYGIEVKINSELILCGNRELMTMHNIPFPVETINKVCKEGKTVLLMAANGIYCGLAAVADTIRPDALSTVERLYRHGIESVLITGDHSITANAVASSLHISRVFSQVLPKDKSSIVNSLKTNNALIAMAGDGINDAPALAAADIGFAVASGTDVALATADIILLGNRLSSLADAIDISEKTMRVIKQNLFWAFFYNCIGISFAGGLLHLFGGPFLSPMICALAMSFSSITVVSNALRLKHVCRTIGVVKATVK